MSAKSESIHEHFALMHRARKKIMAKVLKTMSADKLEVCWRCGKPCNPEIYVFSERKQKNLPVCRVCSEKWLENGRMPR